MKIKVYSTLSYILHVRVPPQYLNKNINCTNKHNKNIKYTAPFPSAGFIYRKNIHIHIKLLTCNGLQFNSWVSQYPLTMTRGTFPCSPARIIAPTPSWNICSAPTIPHEYLLISDLFQIRKFLETPFPLSPSRHQPLPLGCLCGGI